MEHNVIDLAQHEREEIQRLRAQSEQSDRMAMRSAAKARRLEDAILLHLRRKRGEVDDIGFVTAEAIDEMLWRELTPTEADPNLGELG